MLKRSSILALFLAGNMLLGCAPISIAALPPVNKTLIAIEQKELPQLEINKPLLQELQTGDSHRYSLKLNAKDLLHVVVAQKTIDVQLQLIGPDGATLLEIDSPNENHGVEALSFIAETAGNYQLVVAAPAQASPQGKYQITLNELRPATADDKRFIEAQNIMQEAVKLFAQGTPEAVQASIEKFKLVLPILQALNLKVEQANLLDIIASVNNLIGNPQQALEYFQQDLAVQQELKDRLEESQIHILIGDAYQALGEQDKALAKYKEGITVAKEINDQEREALGMVAIALSYGKTNDVKKALKQAEEALSVIRVVPMPITRANLLNRVGDIFNELGDRNRAVEIYQEGIKVAKDNNVPVQAANILTLLGDLLLNMGNLQGALDANKEALNLYRNLKNRTGEASALSNTAVVYTTLGEPDRALDLYNQALVISKEIKDRGTEAYTLNNIGYVYKNLEQYDKALEYFNQALPILQEVGDRIAEASELKNIGEAYTRLNRPKEGLPYLTKALAIHKELNNRQGEAIALATIGFTYDALKNPQQALNYYQPAIKIFRAIYDSDSQVSVLAGMMRAYRKQGNYVKARASIEEAIKIIERLRAQISNSQLRASYFATLQDNYEIYIDLLMEMHKKNPAAGHNATALQISESARARGLLEILAESKADIRQGIDEKLLQREQELQQKINAKAEEQINLSSSGATPEQTKKLEAQLDELTSAYQDLQTEMRKTSPRYAALQYPSPLTVSEIQQQVLDQSTVLLEYALGDERSFLWLVTKNSLESYQLPGRQQIDQAARKVYELLTARNKRIKGETSEQRATRIEAADKEYYSAALDLSKMILAPVSVQLGSKRLLIVTEGALQYVPFAALSLPHVKDYRPLIEAHEIVNLPSASTIGVLRSEIATRKPAEKPLAVIADPVFEKDDERVAGIEIKAGDNQRSGNGETRILAHEEAAQSASESGVGDGLRIPRLPGTLTEADRIAALISNEKKLIGFAANRETINSDELSQYRIIHFATHGFADSQRPELSGVMLSMYDKDGKPQDGFLRAHEIFNLNLPAELVVLSACQTGLGKEVKGEGLVGLTRGFMYAGAARIVVSLWSVSDQATAELMVKFYQKMLKQGERPASALQSAQIEMLQEEQWRAPFFWAAFQIQGEWRR